MCEKLFLFRVHESHPAYFVPLAVCRAVLLIFHGYKHGLVMTASDLQVSVV